MNEHETTPNQTTLFDNLEPDFVSWQTTLPFFDFIRGADNKQTISQHYIYAEVKNNKLYMSCDCNLGRDGVLCDHLIRAIGGDIFLLSDRSKESLETLVQLWNYAVTTRLYDDVCSLAELSSAFTQNSRMLNNELGKSNKPNFHMEQTAANDTEIKRLRVEGKRIKGIVMSKEIELHHFLTTSGYLLDTHTKRENSLRVLEYVSNDEYDNAIYLPLFLPEDADNCGWYMSLCQAFASSCGLIMSERSKLKKRYPVRIQTGNFSFSEGDIFYDTPLARKTSVKWGDALPYIHNIVQVRDVRNAERDGRLVSIVRFTTEDPHDTKEKAFVELHVSDFIRYLICGKR